MLFNIYLDHVTPEWQDNNLAQTSILTTFLFASVPVIMTAKKCSLQKILHQLSKTA
jgi:hypothetical protein